MLTVWKSRCFEDTLRKGDSVNEFINDGYNRSIKYDKTKNLKPKRKNYCWWNSKLFYIQLTTRCDKDNYMMNKKVVLY